MNLDCLSLKGLKFSVKLGRVPFVLNTKVRFWTRLNCKVPPGLSTHPAIASSIRPEPLCRLNDAFVMMISALLQFSPGLVDVPLEQSEYSKTASVTEGP